MMVTNGGKIIRTPVNDVRIAGRSTAGVTLFRTADNEKVVSATVIDHEEESTDDDAVATETVTE
jgi:DNA gyrase subunit A